MSCIHRRTDTDNRGLSFGYCDRGDNGGATCDGLTRNCPSCKKDQPMKGWGYTLESPTVAGMLTPLFVCPDCRHDRDTIARRDGRNNRFTFALNVPEIVRYQLVSELSRSGNGLAVGEINRPILRMVESFKAGKDIDIDTAGMDQAELDSTSAVLRLVGERSIGALYQAAYALREAWGEFAYVEPVRPTATPRNLTPAELSALAHGEKPIVSKTK